MHVPVCRIYFSFFSLLSLSRIGYVAPEFVGSVFDNLDNGHGGSSNFCELAQKLRAPCTDEFSVVFAIYPGCRVSLSFYFLCFLPGSAVEAMVMST